MIYSACWDAIPNCTVSVSPKSKIDGKALPGNPLSLVDLGEVCNVAFLWAIRLTHLWARQNTKPYANSDLNSGSTWQGMWQILPFGKHMLPVDKRVVVFTRTLLATTEAGAKHSDTLRRFKKYNFYIVLKILTAII